MTLKAEAMSMTRSAIAATIALEIIGPMPGVCRQNISDLGLAI
jgi:hypothetical protein